MKAIFTSILYLFYTKISAYSITKKTVSYLCSKHLLLFYWK